MLRAAGNSRGGVLLIEGQSGLGKSRLIGDAVGAAAALGFSIAGGTADETSRLAPLTPLLDALGESVHTLRVARGVAAAIDARLRLVEQLQVRLEERAARGPLLIALDDLQWADPTTLLALRTLIPELASYPLVWLLARTTGGADGDAGHLYDALAREGAVRAALDPLDGRAVAEIVRDVLDAEPAPELLSFVAGAGGNPFLVVQLLGGLRDENAVEVAGGRARLTSRRLPRRVQEVMRGHLDGLSARTRHLLQVAAVLGRGFHVDDLAEMLGESPSRLLPALEKAEAAGYLTPTGDTFAFRHDLLWRAVTETVTVPARRAMHRQAAEMLLARGGSAIPAAAHLMHYARPGDARAPAALDSAVQELLSTSPQTAADLAVRALELGGTGGPGRFRRTVTAVYAMTSAGRPTEAAELARSALDQEVVPGQAAHLRYELAYVLMLAGRPVEAAAEAEKALADEELPNELRGLAAQVFFRALFAAHDYTRGRARAEEVAAGVRGHDMSAMVGARMLLMSTALAEGRASAAIEHIRAAVRAACEGPIRAQHAHPRLHLAMLLTSLRRFDEAEAVLRTAAEEITELGHTAHAASPALFRSWLRRAEGRIDDAVAEAEAGLALADDLGMRAFVLFAIAVLIVVSVRRGDLDAAARHVERYSHEHQDGHGVVYGRIWGDWAVALATEALEGPAAALARYAASYGSPLEQRALLMIEPTAAVWVVRTALAAGDRDRATAVTAEAERLARDNPEFPTIGAAAAHARGVLDGDRTALAHAVAAHAGPWCRASAAEDLGELLAGSGAGADHETAVDRLDEALTGYRRTGAHRDAARVRSRLRELGVRRRHWGQAEERPVSGWAGLTDTERDVATLVAQGLTNRQVAGRMFVSPHTVKFHLRQVFRKLEIVSRVELARLAAGHTAGTGDAGTGDGRAAAAAPPAPDGGSY